MTDQYAVIGNPIGHTKSPLIHMSFAGETGQDITYTAIEGPLGGFAAAVDAFRAGGGRGLNITAPFKLDAFAYATDLRERARLAGAVNAMKFEDGPEGGLEGGSEGGRVIADNFDGVVVIDDDGRILSASAPAREILGRRLSGSAVEALPFALAEAVSAALDPASPGRGASFGEAQLPGRDGAMRFLDYVVTISAVPEAPVGSDF